MKKMDISGEIIADDYQEVYDWFGISASSPQKIKKCLADAAGEDVEATISSGGGDIIAATGIMEAIREYNGHVLLHINYAASAASMIAMAAENDMAPTGLMMVHRVSTTAEGNIHDMERTMDSLAAADKAVAAAYMEKSGMSESDTIAMMDKTTWLTAQQCVDKKLVDKIRHYEQAEPLTACYGFGGFGAIDREKLHLMQKAMEAEKKLNKKDQESAGSGATDDTMQAAQAAYDYLLMEGKKL